MVGRREGRRGFYVAWNEYGADGRRINRMRQFESHRLARMYVTRFNAARDLRLAGELVEISVADAGEEFIRGCGALAPATVGEYEAAIAELEIHAGVFLSGADGGAIDRLIAARSKAVSQASVARTLRSLTRFFNWAIERNYIGANPVKLATSRPRSKHARARPSVDDAQLARLVRTLDTADRRLAVWLAMTTGLDRGAIEQLHAGQVDIKARLIRVRRRKTGKVVAVPIHPLLVPELERRAADVVPGTPLLRGLSRQARDEDWWHRACSAVRLPKLLFRDLRAVASSRLLREKVALPDVQRMLGHASAETTAAHYLIPSEAAAEALASLPLPGFPRSGRLKKA